MGYKVIKLTRGLETKVDEADYLELNKHKWHVIKPNGGFYACRSVWNPETKKKKMVYMHREICGFPEGKVIDHRDGETLNNCRYNLRVCENHQNVANHKIHKHNTSGVTGVFWRKDLEKWGARIEYKGKRTYLGCFLNKDNAIKARKKAEIKYFGEYSNNNKK